MFYLHLYGLEGPKDNKVFQTRYIRTIHYMSSSDWFGFNR